MEAAEFLERVRERTPASAVRDGIDAALRLPSSATPLDGALSIGNGGHVTAQDTVPFTVWSAARCLASYEDALWNTVAGGGDIDTNCAIVGGIVVMRTGEGAIPEEWLHRRETIGATLDAAIRG